MPLWSSPTLLSLASRLCDVIKANGRKGADEHRDLRRKEYHAGGEFGVRMVLNGVFIHVYSLDISLSARLAGGSGLLHGGWAYVSAFSRAPGQTSTVKKGKASILKDSNSTIYNIIYLYNIINTVILYSVESELGAAEAWFLLELGLRVGSEGRKLFYGEEIPNRQ